MIKQWSFVFVARWIRTVLFKSDSVVLTTLAVLIGLMAGLGAVGFHYLLEGTQEFLHFGTEQVIHWLEQDSHSLLADRIVVLYPAIGALLALGLIWLFAHHDHSHGTSAVIEAVTLRGGWLPARPLLTKVVAAGIFIGSGGSAGPEDPSVQLGAVAGSQTGIWLRLSGKRVRTLVASGVAGAVAAAFNAPIAGVFFAFEIVVGELSAALFPPVVLAAVAAAAVGHAFRGNNPAFQVPAYELVNPLMEFPLYAVLGVCTAIIGVLFIRVLFLFEHILRQFTFPTWLRTTVVGITVGFVGIALPQVLGVGYETIGDVLAGATQSYDYYLLLLIVKLLLTALCIGAIGVGGTFAPSLYLGAMTGALVGLVAGRFFPGVPVQAYALVGMGGVLTAVVRAPITSVLLLFELTNDYRIILPIMLCVASSNLIASHLFKESVYTERLARNGIVLRFGRDLNVMEMVRVDEAMTKRLDTIQATATIGEAIDQLNATHHHGMPVVEEVGATDALEERIVGIVTLSDIRRATAKGLNLNDSVMTIATTDLLLTYPDETLNDALRTFSIRDVGRLPVVERANSQRLVGMLRRQDVVRAYSTGVMRRSELEQRITTMQIRSHSGSEVVELIVDKTSPLAGRTVRSLALPNDCLLANVRRGYQARLPRGSTVLRPGDRLTFLASPEAVVQLEGLGSATQTERVNIDLSPRYHRVDIHPDAPAAGKSVRSLSLKGVLLVSVEREDHTLIPHGDTVIQPGDTLTLFAEPYDLPPVLEVLTGSQWT